MHVMVACWTIVPDLYTNDFWRIVNNNYCIYTLDRYLYSPVNYCDDTGTSLRGNQKHIFPYTCASAYCRWLQQTRQICTFWFDWQTLQNMLGSQNVNHSNLCGLGSLRVTFITNDRFIIIQLQWLPRDCRGHMLGKFEGRYMLKFSVQAMHGLRHEYDVCCCAIYIHHVLIMNISLRFNYLSVAEYSTTLTLANRKWLVIYVPPNMNWWEDNPQ